MADHLINVNLKVLLMDTDYFALQAINGYLAWDRRTRVTFLAESEAAMWEYLAHTPLAELPDVVVLDADHLGGAGLLRDAIERLREVSHEIGVEIDNIRAAWHWAVDEINTDYIQKSVYPLYQYFRFVSRYLEAHDTFREAAARLAA